MLRIHVDGLPLSSKFLLRRAEGSRFGGLKSAMLNALIERDDPHRARSKVSQEQTRNSPMTADQLRTPADRTVIDRLVHNY